MTVRVSLCADYVQMTLSPRHKPPSFGSGYWGYCVGSGLIPRSRAILALIPHRLCGFVRFWRDAVRVSRCADSAQMALTKALSHQVLVRAAVLLHRDHQCLRPSIGISVRQKRMNPVTNRFIGRSSGFTCGGCVAIVRWLSPRHKPPSCLVASGLIPRSRASSFVRFAAL